MECKAFTSKYDGISNRLMNDVIVSYNGKSVKTKALWDTGASGTNISKQIAEELELVPTGKVRNMTAGGVTVNDTYLVNVELPNKVIVEDIKVVASEIGNQGLGVLLGMDIIATGDFSISNKNGKTVLTFRTPSQKTTDYVEEIRIDKLVGHHGKGNKKHHK